MKKINQVIKQLFTLAGAITLILLLTISFVGCSNNDNKNNVENPGNITDDGATEEPGDENLPEEDNKTTYHTVSFVTAGGSKVDPIQVKHGEKVATPKIPEKEGHTFEGWYYGEEMWSFIGYVVTEDITLLAKWTVNSYYVTVKDSLGRIYGTKEYAYGTELSSGIISTVSCPYGYHIGSVENQDTGCEWDFNKDKVTGDTTIVVMFDKNQYTVSFKVNDTYYGPSQTILHGDTITKPFDPEREGYTFYGWTYNGIRWNFDMDVVTCNMTLEAKFSIYAPDGDKEDLTFKLQYAAGTVLRMATGYNSAQTGISMHADIAGEGITLADGKTYHAGDLKPTWVELQNVLNVKFEDKYQGKKTAEEFPYWEQQMDQIDMVSGTASDLSVAGTAGKLVNLADYLNDMPNFKKYLNDNPIVLLSISSVDDEGKVGGIYFAPYFDGVNDIERMPLMRTDWVEKLLNGKGEFSAASSKNIAKAVYTPYMPTSGKVSIDVVKADASGTETITKDYDKAGNIVAKMNAAGEISGVEAVNMLRKYIDEVYNGYYGENRADLFIGQNAAWDADELVALLRCVVANPQTLNGTDSVAGIFSRENDNNQRRIDMFRFVGTLFGVRGLESRQDYLYVGADGLLHDARQEEATYEALERMNALVQEGLIASSFVNSESMKTETMLKNDAGFMHYDYNQTQTVFNQTAL